jgi:WhiB family transcriptional regulator, redox-sensing transcriptional regulator
MDDAKCVDADPDIFFPSRGDDTQVAKKICAVCEVWAECLEYALENEQDDGIWGGFSERQRLAMKKLGARALHMQNDELSA